MTPSSIAEWREFLSAYSTEFLNSAHFRELEADGVVDYLLSQEQRASGWLGQEPASEAAVAAAEARLGARFPAPYRNFLLASNGFTCLGDVDLYPLDEVGWFAESEQELFEAWSEPDFADIVAVLEQSLLIAQDNGGSGCYWLLRAQDGEWTAYEWWPGDDPDEHGDFTALASSAKAQLS